LIMNFELNTVGLADAAGLNVDWMVVVMATQRDKPPVPAVGADALSTLVCRAQASGDVGDKAGKCLPVWGVDGIAARRVVLANAGGGSAAEVRRAVHAGLAGVVKGHSSVRRVGIVWAQAPTKGAVRAAVMVAGEALYSFRTSRTQVDEAQVDAVVVCPGVDGDWAAELRAAQAVVNGVALAKEWANRPGNYATPRLLAKAARQLCDTHGFGIEVLGPKEVKALGMGSFLAVAQGSEEPLRFIVMRYQGLASTANEAMAAPVVLVGKGVTFDTGGISIKPAPEMDEMKYDMGGAASVLGVFEALSVLRPAINVVGIIPACENMPDGRAVKPGDVVTAMNGTTIEILNTDAEGRLILCDALTYAERFKPRAVVDMATLTGACVIALGGVRSGLFSTDDALAASLCAAGESAFDPCWRMPLDDDYAEGLKTGFADVANVAGRAGGAITAAKFLQKFATQYTWAHLDIAGTAWKSGAAKGATGRPVPLLTEFLMAEAAKLALLDEAFIELPAATAPIKRARRRTAI
jgi:leucyl aminopeptidase